MPRLVKSLVLLAAAAHLAAGPLTYATPSFALSGNISLPDPYVSRAFDAVLLPIDANVRKVFALDQADEGVLVLSVEPGGVADSQGLLPGDVLYQIHGKKILSPIELDEIAYYWILQGSYDFGFDYYRAGVLSSATALITLELYNAVIDMSSISSWESWSVETGFSYEEFYSEYSSVISESYESSETTIEETVTSEEFVQDVTTEDDFDADDDGIDDAADTDDDGDGVDDAQDTDDDGDGVDDADQGDDGSDDSAADDGSDDGSDDGADDGADDGSDDAGDDSGGDEE